MTLLLEVPPVSSTQLTIAALALAIAIAAALRELDRGPSVRATAIVALIAIGVGLLAPRVAGLLVLAWALGGALSRRGSATDRATAAWIGACAWAVGDLAGGLAEYGDPGVLTHGGAHPVLAFAGVLCAGVLVALAARKERRPAAWAVCVIAFGVAAAAWAWLDRPAQYAISAIPDDELPVARTVEGEPLFVPFLYTSTWCGPTNPGCGLEAHAADRPWSEYPSSPSASGLLIRQQRWPRSTRITQLSAPVILGSAATLRGVDTAAVRDAAVEGTTLHTEWVRVPADMGITVQEVVSACLSLQREYDLRCGR